MNALPAILIMIAAVFFAMCATADITPGKPLYPTRDDQAGLIFALTATLMAFCAGLSL